MASALDTVRSGIEAAFKTAWVDTAEQEASRIAWPNAPFSVPDDGLWVRPTILFGDGGMSTGGTGVTGNVVVGLLKVAVFDKAGKGLGDLYEIADTIRTAFSRQTIGTAYFRAPSGPRDASNEVSGQVVVDCPFEVREA